MLASQGQFLLFHIERSGPFDDVLVSIGIGDNVFSLELAERAELSLDIVFLQLLCHDGVIVPEDKGIVFCLILQDAHL